MSEPTAPNQPGPDPVKQPAHPDLATAEPTHGGAAFTPRVDILESDDELTLLADMPGVALDGVEINFENGELTLHGRVSARTAEGQPIYQEYEIGDFHRVFKIGSSINSSQISAQISDGVLSVHLPKADAIKPRKIHVTAG